MEVAVSDIDRPALAQAGGSVINALVTYINACAKSGRPLGELRVTRWQYDSIVAALEGGGMIATSSIENAREKTFAGVRLVIV